MKYLVVLLLLISNVSSADDNGAVQLTQGQPAPFTGFLITKEKVVSLYNLNIDLEYANKKIDVLSQQNTLVTDQLTKTNALANNLSTQLAETKDKSFWTNTLYFLGGCVLTGFITYGISHVALK